MELEILSKILVLAFLCEALVKTGKDIIWKTKGVHNRGELIILLSNIALGCILAVLFKVDATVLLSGQVGIVGCILTGFIGSRGANFVNDLSKKLRPSA